MLPASFGPSLRPPSVEPPPLPAAASVEPPPDPAFPPEPPVLPPPDPPVAGPPDPALVVVLDVPPLPPDAVEPLLPADPDVCGVELSSPPQCAAAIATSAIDGAIHLRMFMCPPGYKNPTIRTWIIAPQDH
jgi:hypothetical protein